MINIFRLMLVFRFKLDRYVDKNRTKIHVAGLFVLVYETILLYGTFLMAYFHKTKSVTVMVDNIGEAHFEFVVLPLFIIFGLWVVYDVIKREVKT